MRKSIVAAAAIALFATPTFALELDGDLSQGGMVIGTVEPGSEVSLDGDMLPVTDDGKFVIGFGRDHGPTALLAVMKDGTEEQEVWPLEIAKRDYDIQRIDGLPPGKVGGFSAATLKRIRADNAQVAAARRDTSRDEHFLSGFIWPTKGRISGVYGSQRVLNGEPRRPHFGIDIAAPTGTPVLSPASGTVRLAERDHFFTGGIVIIDHGFSVNSTLFHLHSVDVEVGQVVAQGEQIGTVGATGRATGPHLDWRMNWGKQRLDPQLIVGPMPQ
ncbi:MAG: M23 family metallopeptidase [Alphaproteobacteria bacterium]|nr:M23 family metallopeptidase [Alphaproteobacteria bacterium]